MRWITMKEARPVPQDCDRFDMNYFVQPSYRCFVVAVEPEIGRLTDTEDRQVVEYAIHHMKAKYRFKRDGELTRLFIKRQKGQPFTADDEVDFAQLLEEQDSMQNWEFDSFETGGGDASKTFGPDDIIAWYEVPMPDVQLVEWLQDVWAADRAAAERDEVSWAEVVVRTPGMQASRGTIKLDLMHDLDDGLYDDLDDGLYDE